MTDTASAAPTYEQVIAAWNAQADEHNQWDELGEDEKIEWAVACAKAGEPVHGDVLPPVGSRVYIRHGRDNDAHACMVTGYYAWGDLGGDKRLHRVFVRLVYEGTDIQQARMLCDCYPTAEAALAQAAPQQEAQAGAVPLDEARRMFDAGWKAAARFCDREDVVADGIIGFGTCPQFEAAFAAAHGIKGGQQCDAARSQAKEGA